MIMGLTNVDNCFLHRVVIGILKVRYGRWKIKSIKIWWTLGLKV